METKTKTTNSRLSLIRTGGKQNINTNIQSETSWRLPGMLIGSPRILAKAATVAALCLFSLSAGLRADEPFSRDFAPTLRFTENYTETVLTTREDGAVWHEVVPNLAASKMTINAKLSTQGMNLGDIDEFTEVQISVGNFSFQATLYDDPDYSQGDTTARFPLYAWDNQQVDFVEVGAVVLNWGGGALTIAVTAAQPTEYSIDSQNQTGRISDVDVDLDCSVRFGDRLLEGRTAYESGTTDVVTRTVGSGDEAEELELSVVRLVGAIDSEKPKIALTSLAKSGIVTSPSMDLSGTASDNIGVGMVNVSVNGGDFVPAMLDGKAWTLRSVGLQPGENIVRIKAADIGENESDVLTRKVSYLTPITVAVSGNGSVGGGLLGTTLQKPGALLTLKALPASGWVFDGWSGSTTAGNAMLSMVVTPGANLTARFIVNPFTPVKGSYTGLVQGAGSFSASVNANGSFSAKVNIGGVASTITGAFGNDGRYTATIARAGQSDLAVNLNLDVSGGSDSIAGTISDGTRTYDVSGDRSVFSATNPAPQAGTYTVLLPADASAAGTPQGDGYATLRVSTLGVATMVGALGDGTAFSGTAPVTKNGLLPISIAPYKNGGLLHGTATFRDTAGVSDLDATLLWSKQANSADAFYPAGFEASAALVGGKFSAPPIGERIVNLRNALVTVGGGNMAAEISKFATLNSANLLTIAAPGTSRLAVQIIPVTGLFRGTVVDTQTGATRNFQGAFLQKQNVGSGLFRGVNRTGYVNIAAQ